MRLNHILKCFKKEKYIKKSMTFLNVLSNSVGTLSPVEYNIWIYSSYAGWNIFLNPYLIKKEKLVMLLVCCSSLNGYKELSKEESLSLISLQKLLSFKESISWVVSFQNHVSNHLCKLNTNLQIYEKSVCFCYWHTATMPG